MARTGTTLSIKMLGPLQVVLDGAVVPMRPAQRRVLAILLVDPMGAMDRETLIDRMWGDRAPAQAAAALHVHLSGIRRAAPGLLVTSGTGYRVDLTNRRSDRREFERLAARAIADGATGSWDGARRAAERALASWRGTPFEELRDDEIAAAEVARLVVLRDELMELRARALLARQQIGEGIAELRRLVGLHPLREPLWGSLMLALHGAGRSAEALHAYQEARGILASELGVEPGPELRQLEERIAGGDEVLRADTTSATVVSGLPVVRTSFVGREEDVRGVTELLASDRLVTIIGGPGIGKTRLAIEAGHAMSPRVRGAVRFVRLGEARTEHDVTGAVARAVGMRSQTSGFVELAERSADQHAILVLDECEHALAPVAAFARAVLARRGGMRILATSRRLLDLPDEVAWRVGPLAPPPPDGGLPDAGRVVASPAVRLFLDRARATDRTYRLTPESTAQVAALCRRADGIPLALELAAAWVPALGLAEIGDMLGGDEAPPDGDGGGARQGRHRSLHAAMAWSLAMLAPIDRDLFESLGVFRGAFGLDDVVGVCAIDGDRRRTAASIVRLVDASLVVADRRPDGSVTYRLLAPIRDFARERSERRSDWTDIRARFVDHYLAKTQRPDLDLLRGVVDLGRVDDDLDNLREAFTMGIDGGRADDVVRAIVPLDSYFLNRYLAREQRTWLRRALPLTTDPVVRAHGLLSAGFAAQATNDLDGALESIEAALRAFRDHDDRGGIERGLVSLSGLHSNRGAWTVGAEAAREALRRIGDRDDPSSLGVAAHYLGTNLAYGGLVAEGLVELERAADAFRRSGEFGRVSHVLSTIVFLGVHVGDEALARRHRDDALDLARRSESTVRLVRAMGASACLDGRWGNLRAAAQLLTEADERLQIQANEVLFEFLFPTGFLVRRCERWDLLADLVATVDDAIRATGQGYPVPWRDTSRRWALESARAPGLSSERRRDTVDDLVGSMRSDVRGFLAGVASGADRPQENSAL